MSTLRHAEADVTAARAELVEAWEAGTGRRLADWEHSLLDPERLTPRLIGRVTEVARWLVDAPLPVPGQRYLRGSLVDAITRRLVEMAKHMRPGVAFPMDEVLAWLDVAAGHPDTETSCWWEVRLGMEVGETFQWRTAALPAGVAPLAHAAGLSVAEACSRHAVGTLDADALRAFVVLRGYRLP